MPPSPESADQLQPALFAEDPSVMPPRRSRRARRRGETLPLAPSWPPHDRFPYNDPVQGARVETVVLADLQTSERPLIITGYTSLPMIVRLLTHYADTPPSGGVRLLLGHEPTVSTIPVFRTRTLARDIEAYWLEKGLSVYQSAAVIKAISFLEDGEVNVRISDDPRRPVHAKLYWTEHAVTLGSSNLSFAGMRIQLEANERHSAVEGERYAQATLLAEQIWANGHDYRAGLIALLRRLLREVTWQEAVARACTEILDGLWARRYTLLDPLDRAPALWPAQTQGVAQAMWLVEQVGSILVADATGSGKTRLGAEILRAMVNRLWAQGRVRNHVPVLIAPPRVLPEWERHAAGINLPVERYAHTILSRPNSETHAIQHELLQRAQVLAIDEAHNFLNTTSNRSRTLLQTAPEHTLLLTATPINRELSDLVTMINLLGPDNFDDEIIDLVVQATQVRPSGTEDTGIGDADLELLQRAIRQFTLRRTKRQFNALIDENPAAYRNRLGDLCRYPRTIPHIYATGETEQDQRWIGHIRNALEHLTGMAYVHKVLRLPDSPRWRTRPDAEQVWLGGMLRSAKALAAYQVISALRSSRVAALEHLLGTHAAWTACGYGSTPPLKQGGQSGNMRQRVAELGGRLPVNQLHTQDLPAILCDPDSHRRACEQDSEIYDAVSKMILQLTDAREQTKATLLAEQLQRLPLLLAFDARPITIHDIGRRLAALGVEARIATPERTADCDRVMHEFRLGSTASGIVALCTDAMSEGINLQAASGIVHLDLPTVVRRLEQRDGRLNRMDTGHPTVESWLPADSEAFAPRSGEEAIYRRYRLVETLLGGNVTLPVHQVDESETDSEIEVILPDDTPLVTPNTVLAARHAREQQLEGLADAFSPVRELVGGPTALIPPAMYTHYRQVQARVVSSVTAVAAEHPWVFACLAGAVQGAPRFVFLDLDDDTAPALTSLEAVAERLRQRLGTVPSQRPYDGAAADLLIAALKRLNAEEEQLLPRRKQRVLLEMRAIVPRYRPPVRRDGGASEDVTRAEVVTSLLDLLNGPRVRPGIDGRSYLVDLGVLADRWLTAIRPAWSAVAKTRRRKLLLLRDLRSHLVTEPLSTEQLQVLIDDDGLWTQPLDERMVAAIVGVMDAGRVGDTSVPPLVIDRG